jgi:hypothetical protein
MSFDLIFCKTKGKADASMLLEYFRSRKHMSCEQHEDTFEVTYQNLDTGVYGSFYYTPLENNDDFPPEWREHGATGLSASINFLRPSFFALEFMSEIEALCKANDLLVLDSNNGNDEKPKPCVAAELISSWEQNNLSFIPAAAQANILPPYLAKDKSLYLWNYSRAHGSLEKRFESDDVFVPKLIPVKRKNENQVKTVISWADGIPIVLPTCDIVILKKVHSKGFLGIGKKEEFGWIRFDSVVNAIKPHLRNYTVKDFPILEMFIATAATTNKVKEALLKVPFDGDVDEFEAVGMDGFIDIDK